MPDVRSPYDIKRSRRESENVLKIKRLLVALGLKLGFKVAVEEIPESELGDLGIRHDVVWYTEAPDWYSKLLEIISLREDLEPEYKKLIQSKLKLRRHLYAAFEIEGSDLMTKAMKGDISNLSKWPYSVIVVKRGVEEAKEESQSRGRYVEPIRNRFERALMEFRRLHGPNNIVIASFSDIEKLCKECGITL